MRSRSIRSSFRDEGRKRTRSTDASRYTPTNGLARSGVVAQTLSIAEDVRATIPVAQSTDRDHRSPARLLPGLLVIDTKRLTPLARDLLIGFAVAPQSEPQEQTIGHRDVCENARFLIAI